ncbi:MAG: hypothetical protein WCO35_01540 [Candidatus Nomurabacteria bacterium]
MNLDIIFQEFLTSNHHTFLLETNNRERDFKFFHSKLQEESKTDEIFSIDLKVFDIEKAREVVNYGKTSFETKHYIVISFYSINREAQNVLLKFLEETPNNVKIIFIIHAGAKILKTIYSRVYKLNSENELNTENNEVENLAKTFLETKKLSRMKIKEIVELLAKKDEYAEEFEDKERSDREVVEVFLLALHSELFKEYKKTKDPSLLSNLEELTEYLKYIKNNSSSGKTILEFLSLRLPEID